MAGRADPLGLSTRALYFLLSFAADLYDPREELFAGEASASTPDELLFRALSDAAAGIIRRGADRVYVEESTFGPSIRGRIDMGRTMARDLGMGMRAVSVVARLSPSCPQNDAIKTALSIAESEPELESSARERARLLARAFPGERLRTIAEARAALGRARIHRNNAGYRRALFWAKLVLSSVRPSGGEYRLDNPFDRRFMNRAFEAFVRRGLAISLAGTAKVARTQMPWNPRTASRSPLEPRMITDLTIRGGDRCMVVDAKYYSLPFSDHRDGALKLRSDHLYQIASYLRVLRRRDEFKRPWSACLVYARKNESFDHRVDLGDFRLRTIGIDLEADSAAVIGQLASIWRSIM